MSNHDRADLDREPLAGEQVIPAPLFPVRDHPVGSHVDAMSNVHGWDIGL